MPNPSHLIDKAVRTVLRRFREQGVRTTFLWMYGRILPGITGVPNLKFCAVTPHLYVGSQFNQAGKRLLEREGFTGCVNMRIERDDAAQGLDLVRYLHLPTIDDDAPTIEHLDQGVQFIREIINGGSKVYIHCGAGVGRAPTMAAAYLIAEGKSLEEALRMIRSVRPFIAITPPQMEQLQRYAARFEAEQLQVRLEKPSERLSSTTE